MQGQLSSSVCSNSESLDLNNDGTRLLYLMGLVVIIFFSSEACSFIDPPFYGVNKDAISTIVIEENEIGFCRLDGRVESEHSGFDGVGYSNGENDIGQSIIWRISTGDDGELELKWIYALGADSRTADIFVNGEKVISNIVFERTGDWENWEQFEITLDLDSGDHEIRLESTGREGLPNIDSLTVTGKNPAAEECADDQDDTEDAECDFSLVGWANEADSTTGGRGGETVRVSNASELEDALEGDSARVIEFSGVIEGFFEIGSNKTLLGRDSDATIAGSLVINGSHNIILQNFNVDAGALPCEEGQSMCEDGISILGESHHIWLDHLAVFDAVDGNLDIKQASDYITVSWTIFYYDRDGDHRYSNLIGASDNSTEDIGHLNVTLHHCWWARGVTERMPRIRFGRVHSFNNYFASPGSRYCIRAAKGSSVRIENNYFDQVRNPHEIRYEDGSPADVLAVGNIYDETSGARDETGSAFHPPYEYDLDPARGVPEMVRTCAGPQ